MVGQSSTEITGKVDAYVPDALVLIVLFLYETLSFQPLQYKIPSFLIQSVFRV